MKSAREIAENIVFGGPANRQSETMQMMQMNQVMVVEQALNEFADAKLEEAAEACEATDTSDWGMAFRGVESEFSDKVRALKSKKDTTP